MKVRIVTNKLITSLPKLEVRSRWGQFVNELVDSVAQPCIFITLQIGLQIVFREPFINLKKHENWLNESYCELPLQKDPRHRHDRQTKVSSVFMLYDKHLYSPMIC
jgi:hypothetical protein